jgi:4-nitrophenyl phosphatase
MTRLLKKVELFLIDIDGVVVRGRTPIEGATEGIAILNDSGVKVMFVTNNSTKSRKMLLEELRKFSIITTKDKVLSTSYCAARYISSLGLEKIYAIGERGLYDELSEAGLTIIDDDEKECDVVLIGLDRNVTYNKLATAHKFIRDGAKFIATNTDATLPTERGDLPGAGAIVSSLITSLGKRPLILGKPNTILLELAKEKIGDDVYCGLVGDRPETDIAMAKKGKCLGILVLTGIASSTNTNDYPEEYRPDLIYPSLLEVARDFR